MTVESVIVQVYVLYSSLWYSLSLIYYKFNKIHEICMYLDI